MNNTFYYNASENSGTYEFSLRLNAMMNDKINSTQEIIYLCIGSDRSTGDCLGPLVGHRLCHLPSFSGSIYGTLKNPVHAINLSDTIEQIYAMHRNPFIIAIDASLGAKSHIGHVVLSDNPLKPGLGVKKKLPEVGDISITGVVSFSGVMDSIILQTTRLSCVMDLSSYISHGLLLASHLRRKSLLNIL